MAKPNIKPINPTLTKSWSTLRQNKYNKEDKVNKRQEISKRKIIINLKIKKNIMKKRKN